MIAADAFGVLGNITALVFSILPLYLIIDMWKTKNTEKIPYFLFIFSLLNCVFWMAYGIIENKWPIYVGNGIGTLTSCFYLFNFLIYYFEETSKKILLIMMIVLCTFLLFFLLLSYKNEKVIGIIACIMNTLMYISPLQKINEVFKYNDNSYIPIWISILIVVNCIFWVGYGILQNFNLYLIIPNGLGILVGIIQIIIWFRFKKGENIHKKNEDEEKFTLINKNY